LTFCTEQIQQSPATGGVYLLTSLGERSEIEWKLGFFTISNHFPKFQRYPKSYLLKGSKVEITEKPSHKAFVYSPNSHKQEDN
jgi:hypothetical protein